jgi:carbamoyltransferase
MEIQLFQYHPVIGYTFIPNLKTRIEHESGGYLFRTNSSGFRSEREFAKEKSEGVFRILLFGDSFTAGDGVSNKYRFSDVLESSLPGIEVYNFGLPGTGTDQHYLVWNEIAKQYEHDLVVIAVQVENIRRVAARFRTSVNSSGKEVVFAKPYFELNDTQLALRGVPVDKRELTQNDLPESERGFVDQGGRMPMLRKIVNKLGGPVKEATQRITGYQPLPEYDDAQGTEWQLLSAILEHWSDEIKSPAIVMPIPLYHYVEETASPDAYRERFSELGTRIKALVHDPLEDYFRVDKSERRVFRFENDIHPTPAHHALLARSLSTAISPFLTKPAEEAAAK